MVASIPETEKSIFSRRVMYRAAQQVTVPQSETTMASSVRNWLTAWATTWGLSGLSVRLARQGVDERAADLPGQVKHLGAGAQRAAAGEEGDLLAFVDDLGGGLEVRPGGQDGGGRLVVGAVALDVGLRALGVGGGPLLDVLGDAEMGDTPARQGGADGLDDGAGYVAGAHAA